MKNRILAALVFVVFSTPAFAVANDPKAIVLDIYALIKANNEYDPPNTVFTPRLAKLLADDTADAKGEVGRLDVSVWLNAQDSQLGPVTVTEAKTDDFRKDRQTVVAKVTDFGKVQTVVFYFEKIGGKWLVDDIRWTGKDGWVLSLLLKYSDYGPD